MRWHALTNPKVIAMRASIEEIDAYLKKIEGSIAAQLLRVVTMHEPVRVRKARAAIDLLKRQHLNLSEARSIWIDDFRRTESGDPS